MVQDAIYKVSIFWPGDLSCDSESFQVSGSRNWSDAEVDILSVYPSWNVLEFCCIATWFQSHLHGFKMNNCPPLWGDQGWSKGYFFRRYVCMMTHSSLLSWLAMKTQRVQYLIIQCCHHVFCVPLKGFPLQDARNQYIINQVSWLFVVPDTMVSDFVLIVISRHQASIPDHLPILCINRKKLLCKLLAGLDSHYCFLSQWHIDHSCPAEPTWSSHNVFVVADQFASQLGGLNQMYQKRNDPTSSLRCYFF